MYKPASTNQMVLPGLEQALCKCGCNEYFMRVAKGRRREYINATHKKRAARRLAKERRVDTPVRLGPLGYLYLRTTHEDTARHLWSQLGGPERAVLTALCATGMSAEQIISAVTFLFWRGD